MRRVVLVTNVLVSALLSPRGNAAVILRMISDGLLEAVYSQKILNEYFEVLCRSRFAFDRIIVDSALELFTLLGICIEPQPSSFALPDESDRIFYDTARAASAMLITGNLKHYPSEAFIVSPADFIAGL